MLKHKALIGAWWTWLELLFICSITTYCLTHGEITSFGNSPLPLEAKHTTPTSKHCIYFPVFPCWKNDSYFVYILFKWNDLGKWTHIRREEVVFVSMLLVMFCSRVYSSQQSDQHLSGELKVKTKQPSSSVFTTEKEQHTAYASRGAFKYGYNRFHGAHKVVFRCVLLWETEGTLFASAPSRPDVLLSFKITGSGLSSVSRTVFKSACSLPFWFSVQVTAQCWQKHNTRTNTDMVKFPLLITI